MKVTLLVLILSGACAVLSAAEPKKPRRTRTVPGPYPAIIKLPRVAEAPDRPATSVLLFDTDLSGRELVFLQTAHVAGLRQLALARLAAGRAQSAELRAVAEALGGTQEQENKQVVRLASLKGLSLAQPVERDLTGDLETLSRVDFDQRWTEQLVAVNESVVAAYEAATQVADVEVQIFAEEMLPLAKSKLQVVQRLAGQASRGAAAKR